MRIQWDPERDLDFKPLHYRSIQIGLGGESVGCYVNDWIVSITDVTDLMKEISLLVSEGKYKDAKARVPLEEVYALSPTLKAISGAS